MRREYWVYIFMAVALIAGLWAILAVGGDLTAPADLAGRWELIPLDERTATPAEMIVEQSGRYFQLSLGTGEFYRLELLQQQRFEGNEERELLMKLAGGGTVAEFHGPYRGKIYGFELTRNGQSRRWTALWVERTYRRPRDSSGIAAAPSDAS